MSATRASSCSSSPAIAAGRRGWPTSPRFARPTCAAFLPTDASGGAGARTLGRGLAGIRSLLRFLERRGLANAAGAAALRAPRQPKSLPKPLTASDARRVVSADDQLADEPWIAARNAAVLTLLYGSGLRISEALADHGRRAFRA